MLGQDATPGGRSQRGDRQRTEPRQSGDKFVIVVILLAFVHVGMNSMVGNSIGPGDATTFVTKSSSESSSVSESESESYRRSRKMCVSKGEDLQRLVNETSSVIFVTPSKSGSTANNDFSRLCTPNAPINAIRTGTHTNWTDYLTKHFEIPPVLSLYTDDPHLNGDWWLENLRQAYSKTLLLFSHRQETSRLQSAIRMELRTLCPPCRKTKSPNCAWINRDFGFEPLESTWERCTVSEGDLIRHVIQNSKFEVLLSSEMFLTCDTYQAIRDALPNMLFLDYRNTNDLHRQVAQKHCPHLLDQLPISSNVADANKQRYFVRLDREHDSTVDRNHTVDLLDWLREKGPHLEMMLRTRKRSSCVGTTRRMEDALGWCEDHIVRIHDDWLGR